MDEYQDISTFHGKHGLYMIIDDDNQEYAAWYKDGEWKVNIKTAYYGKYCHNPIMWKDYKYEGVY
jgi:hypothetical protein